MLSGDTLIAFGSSFSFIESAILTSSKKESNMKIESWDFTLNKHTFITRILDSKNEKSKVHSVSFNLDGITSVQGQKYDFRYYHCIKFQNPKFFLDFCLYLSVQVESGLLGFGYCSGWEHFWARVKQRRFIDIGAATKHII